MKPDTSEKQKLSIKKYSNRRFYDATRKTHVTLGELHDLVVAGHEVEITDSKTGEDITRQILTQIILERDSDKLDIFSPNVLHQMIRTQQQFLGGVLEQFFNEMLQAHRVSQERWATFLQNTLGFVPPMAGMPGTSANPMGWTKMWMNALSGKPATGAQPPPPRSSNSAPQSTSESAKIDELQRKLAEMNKRLEGLDRKR